MTSAFLTLTKGQGHTTRSTVTDVEVSAFSECFLFFFCYFSFFGISHSAFFFFFFNYSVLHFECSLGTGYHGKGGPLKVSQQNTLELTDLWLQAGKEMGLNETDYNGETMEGWSSHFDCIFQGGI